MPVIPPTDLAILRTYPQKSRLYLVIQNAIRYNGVDFELDDAVWRGRIDVAPGGTDPVVSLTVRSDPAQSTAQLKDGMTVLFSALGYGLWDRGIARLHGDQTLLGGAVQDTMYIHATSDVARIGVLEYVTILDEHRFWTRYPKVGGTPEALLWYKDYGYFASSLGEAPTDIAYTWTQLGANDVQRRQASMPAVPVMGPHAVRFIDPTVGSVNINLTGRDLTR